jgi:hypothetical protein
MVSVEGKHIGCLFGDYEYNLSRVEGGVVGMVFYIEGWE